MKKLCSWSMRKLTSALGIELAHLVIAAAHVCTTGFVTLAVFLPAINAADTATNLVGLVFAAGSGVWFLAGARKILASLAEAKG